MFFYSPQSVSCFAEIIKFQLLPVDLLICVCVFTRIYPLSGIFTSWGTTWILKYNPNRDYFQLSLWRKYISPLYMEKTIYLVSRKVIRFLSHPNFWFIFKLGLWNNFSQEFSFFNVAPLLFWNSWLRLQFLYFSRSLLLLGFLS